MAKSMVIVGYGAGVSASTARLFAAEGYRLGLIARDPVKLEAACLGLRDEGHDAAGFPADAGDEKSLSAALSAAAARFGDPEVLLYNAFSWGAGPVLSLAPDDLDAAFRICTAGALTAARSVVPAMRAAGRGSLLFTGGGYAIRPSPQAPALSIGKAGMRALALMLAEELAPSGIRVATITIMGSVQPGTSLDPDRIAGEFLRLHDEPPDPTTAEFQMR